MKRLIKLCCLTFLIGCSIALEAPDATKSTAAIRQQYPAGSYENPVKLELKDIKTYDRLEYDLKEYIRKNYENYWVGTSYTMHGDRYILLITLTELTDKGEINPDKLTHVYFDMTDAYKKLRTKDKTTRDRIKKEEDKHKPLTEEQIRKILKEQNIRKSKK